MKHAVILIDALLLLLNITISTPLSVRSFPRNGLDHFTRTLCHFQVQIHKREKTPLGFLSDRTLENHKPCL
uniref:Putative secreted protein n=1 Tax=Anopheles darlingi TaxID=43151 RepID=A0A2M4DDK9_ANODA